MPEWENRPSLELISQRGSPSAARQFLVFVVPSSGRASPLLHALDEGRNFDLAVRFYEPPGVNEGLAEQAEFVMTGGLSKFHSASLFIERCNLTKSYDGYLFLDGDLEFDATRLGRFLSFVHAAKFDLAQPAVTRDSHCYWKMAYHQPGYLFRDTSFVEVMAPYFSRSALSRTLETFPRSISSYGLDFVWPTLIDGSAIAVVDAFQMSHRDQVDRVGGAFYRYLRSIGVNLDEEERRILAHYGVARQRAHSRRGYFWKSAPTKSFRPPRLMSVPLGRPEKRTQKQSMIDAAARIARLYLSPLHRPEDQLAATIEPYVTGLRI